MMTFFITLILMTEHDGPFRLEALIHAETIELYHASRASIIETETNIYILLTETQTLVKLSRNGQVLKTFKTREGTGPKEFGKSKSFFILNEKLIVLNNINSQALVFDLDLAFLEQQKVDFRGFSAVSDGERAWVGLIRDQQQLGLYGKDLKPLGSWFPRSQRRSLMEKKFVIPSRGGIVVADYLLWPEQPYNLAYYHWPTESSLETGKPTWRIQGPPLPEEFTGKAKTGPVSPRDFAGGFNRTWQNNKLLVAQIQINTGQRDALLYNFDIFSVSNGDFLGRHVANYEMIPSQGPHFFVLRGDEVLRVVHIKL